MNDLNIYDNGGVPEEQISLAESYMRKWKRLMSVSKTIRRIMLVVAILFASIGAISTYGNNFRWYIVALCGLICFLTALVLCGALILILKPLFCFLRKRARIYHQYLIDEEETQYYNELALVEKYEESLLYDMKEKEQSILHIAKNHKKAIRGITECSADIREWEMEKAKYNEWLWVIHAGEILLCTVFFVILALVVMVIIAWFLFRIIGVIYGVDGDRRRYYHEPYQEHTDKPSLFDVFTSQWKTRTEYVAEIKNTKTRLAKKFCLKEDVLNQLEEHGIELPEILYAPYFEKYIAQGYMLYLENCEKRSEFLLEDDKDE